MSQSAVTLHNIDNPPCLSSNPLVMISNQRLQPTRSVNKQSWSQGLLLCKTRRFLP